MEGHKVQKSFNKFLAPLEEMSHVSCQYLASPECENGPWWTRQAGGKVSNHFK